jgi:hypothetical protein
VVVVFVSVAVDFELVHDGTVVAAVEPVVLVTGVHLDVALSESVFEPKPSFAYLLQ